MLTTDHPAWTDYKAALRRLEEAGLRLEAAQAKGPLEMDDAERALREALAEYEAARELLAEPAPTSLTDILYPERG